MRTKHNEIRSPLALRVVVIAFLLASALAAVPQPAPLQAAPASINRANTSAQTGGVSCQVYQPNPAAGKDAYIKQEKVDERRGSDPELRVKTETGKLQRVLLQFNITGIPAGALITNATLSLYVKDATGGPVTINAHRVTQSWNEAEVTWKARDKAASQLWTQAGGDYEAAVAGSATVDDTKNIWRTWSVTGLVGGWVNNPGSNLGLILESPVTNPKTEKKFKSSDDGTLAQRPKLEVCYSSGLAISPDNSGDGVPGYTRTYQHTVYVGNITTVVNLAAHSSAGWPVRIYRDVNGDGVKDPEDTLISATPSIGPNVDYPILVQVDVPASAPNNASDTTTITATAAVNGSQDTATDTTRVGRLLSVTPSYDRYATAGSAMFYGHIVSNNGPTQDCVTISAVSNSGWTTYLWEDLNGNGVHETNNPNEPALASPRCLAPGASLKIVAEVRVPAGAAEGTIDTTTVTMASGAQAGESGRTTDITRVFVNTPPVIDGKYDTIYDVSPDANRVCYNSGGKLFGKLVTFYQPTGDAVYMVLAIDKDFVDNTYGTNAINWSGGHTFGNLTGSDHAQYYGYDAAGNLVLDFKQDYLTSTTGTPSGYDSLGVLGGEGQMNVGNEAHILEWGTSLAYSMNETGYCTGGNCAVLGTDLEQNSPATDSTYIQNPTYPNFIFDVIYELKISKAAFPGGFGSLEVPYIHASPSKIGTNTVYAEPGLCPGEIGDTVWYDTDHDGVQDAGENGIANIQLKLYSDNGDGSFNATTDTLVGTQTTNANGRYLFQDLSPNDYFVDVVDNTVPAGYSITTYNDPTPVISLGEGVSYLDADFGYVEAYPDVEIDKSYTGPDPARVGDTVSFNLRVTNTGLSTITVLPLQDWYDTGVLDFVSASPAPDSTLDDGTLNWSDLTASFGRDLPPGDSFEVTVQMKATVATSGTQAAAAAAEPAALDACTATSTLVSDFNATAIPSPRVIWFNSHIKASGLPSGTTTVYYENATITFATGSTSYNLTVPKGKIVFSPTATQTTTNYDTVTQTWITTVSSGNFSKNVWLTGLAFPVPAAGLPGSIKNVTWTGSFKTDRPGVKLDWQWSAAVYTTFSTNYNALGVKPVDSSTQNPYNNSDHVGTPENYKTYVVSGARGGGGSNYTGSWSATGGAEPCEYIVPINGSIGDRVFYDLNNDGLPDNDGEPGLDGVTINLYPGACPATGAVYRTATTASNGTYLFGNLPAGTYCVDVVEGTLPPSIALTTANEPLTIVLATDQDYRSADFGYRANCPSGTPDLATVTGAQDAAGKTAPTVSDDACVPILPATTTIGDRVWNDYNGNGLQDTNEPGVPGVTVKLYTGGGSLAGTKTTDGSGLYTFGSLAPGSFYVEFTLPAGFIFSPQDQGSDDARDSDPNPATGRTVTFTAAAGVNDPTRDAGLIQVASLGDTVWTDTNADGIQAANEPGVAGVTVRLYDPFFNLLGTATTGTNGKYTFANLTPGDYCIQFVAPTGSAFTLPNQGADDGLDSDADPGNGQAGCTTLSPGENDLTWDAGVIIPGAIGDFVWYDSNGDGIENVGEPGIGNVTLELYKDGVLISQTVTDADGGYLFPGLGPGLYTVDVTDDYGVLVGLDHVLANQSMPDPIFVNLSAGEVYKDADFGYVRPLIGNEATIGDTVWYDANGDGIQQPSEPGIPGVQVCATSVAGGTPICATTDTNGKYLVTVPAGSYNVAPTNPPAGYSATTPVPHPVTVNAGDQYLDADFGYDSPGLGAIGNLVFYDNNLPLGNGVFDAGDTPVAGVSVDLIRDANGNKAWDAGEPIIATVTTGSSLDSANGANGNYLFTGLPSGNYLVHVSDTNAVLTGYRKSQLGTANVDNHNQADPYPVSLPASATLLTADFGYEKGGGTSIGDPDGRIGNQVWIEEDGDGLFNPADGDFGQPGVTVELYKDGQPYSSTITGASGRYIFLKLPAGNYTVFVSDLSGVLAAYNVTTLGPNPGQDHNNQAQPYAITLPLGGSNPTADFGYIQPATLGDYVWYDTDADGIQDVFEPGIGNVTLNLYRDNGDNTLNVSTDRLARTVTTGADGGYLATDLLPGVYFVDVTDTRGALAGLTHTTGPQSQPDPTGPIPLDPGEIYRDADFGYVRVPPDGSAVIGDTVWYDGDGDGLRDPGEPGIAGVQVCATLLPNGSQTCATTDEDGTYLIVVPAGTYSVQPTNPPAGYTATTPVPLSPVTVGAGDQYLDADFGYDSPNLAALGGTVWNDTSNDGLLDGDEPVLPGVSVDLVRDLDGDGVRDANEPILATDTTDELGNYLFNGLPAGNYLVVVSDTQNVLDDFTPTILGDPGVDNNNQKQPYPVALSAGETDTTGDFGYVIEMTLDLLGVIGNQVWYETDGNGVYNQEGGDTGIAGVTVTLYRDGKPYDTTTTGAGGDYVFTSLPAGSYTVRVTDSAGVLADYVLTNLGPTPGADNNHQAQPYAITLAQAGINLTADFGYTRPGAIGDFVWYDTNRNGIQDVGEPGIANVTLNLLAHNTVIATTRTDADGGYLFPGLKPGLYTVDVTDSLGKLTGLSHIIANQSMDDPTAPIDLSAGEVYKDADFGYARVPSVGKAIIGDTVWYDENADGIQQPSEIGIPGVQVCATPAAGGSSVCATTDSNGYYRLEVPAGATTPTAYNVQPTNPPAGYSATTAVPHPVSVKAGEQYLDADFGYDSANLGKIGNLVFLDQERDGIYNNTDTPLAGVSVDLIRDADGDKTWDANEPIIGTATTAGVTDGDTGNYLFTGVPAGTYLVHVSDTNAVLTDYVKSRLGTANTNNHNQADPYAVTLAAGGSVLTADFGYYRTQRPDVGVIGNQVWIEMDADGLYNAAGSDMGRPGVTVQLWRSGTPYGLTTSGASGDYSFTGLPTGVYTVTVTDDFSILSGYTVTTLGANPGQDNNNQAQPYTVNLPTAGTNLTADFGYIEPKSSIGDTVFYDDDRSGTQELTEAGMPGIVVQLFTDEGGNCNKLVATETTDPHGKYLFPNLAAGHYCVLVPETAETNPFLLGFSRSAGTNPHVVTLAADQKYLDADFGYTGSGEIRGLVYYDWNQDKTKGTTEDTIPNVNVCLYVDANHDGLKDSTTPVACDVTDNQGFYSFSGQRPGIYIVEEEDPSGLFSSTTNQINTSLVLTQGTGISDGNNFGDLLKVRLGDFVWIDVDADGIQDPTETTGLNGVPLQVIGTNIASQAVNLTINTTNGSYLEADLIPGTYVVTAPDSFNGYARSSPQTRTTTLTVSITEDMTLDFGYAYPTGVQVQGPNATSANGQVTLTWQVTGGTEGFKVWRADNVKGTDAVLLTPDPVLPDAEGRFTYIDALVKPGLTYWYWLEYATDGQRFGPVSVTVRSDSDSQQSIYLPFIMRP